VNDRAVQAAADRAEPPGTEPAEPELTGAGLPVTGPVDPADERWLDLLREIVDIDSGPDSPEGAHAVMDRLGEELAELGFTCQRQPTHDGPDVFVAHRPAGRPDAPRILMIGHADTVFFAGAAAQRPFTVTDGIATGPGVADMKGGLVVQVAGLAAMSEAERDGLDLTIMINGDEEQGSAHSEASFIAASSSADIALVFEPGRPGGMAVHSRRGAQRYRVVVTGKAAHTGVNPEDGANAIEALAHHVLAIQQLGRDIATGSVTAAVMAGGSRPNIVPDAAYVHVDTRNDDDETAARIRQGMMALDGTSPVAGTSTVVEVLDGRPAFLRSEGGDALAAVFAEAAADIGVPFSTVATGGSSDGNFTAGQGVPTLDGLGAVGGGYHTVEEHLEVASIEVRARLCHAALIRLSQQQIR